MERRLVLIDGADERTVERAFNSIVSKLYSYISNVHGDSVNSIILQAAVVFPVDSMVYQNLLGNGGIPKDKILQLTQLVQRDNVLYPTALHTFLELLLNLNGHDHLSRFVENFIIQNFGNHLEISNVNVNSA